MIEFKVETEGDQIILYWRRDCWAITDWNRHAVVYSLEEVESEKKAILDWLESPKEINEDDDSIPF